MRRGTVRVWVKWGLPAERTLLATLGDNDFFGERALEGTDGRFYYIDESESPVKSELSSASPVKPAGLGKPGGGGFPEIAGRGVMPAPRG